ncbi:unnamed protein product [Bemisia tabaci]|uniref:PID domain-containing protein n=2 Tax=Bemisia tabaci TaxID=7038 RepID=A0A9P0C882_BEMTA|nr:unnamed protein product [Bemisia tabaci]
MGATASHQPLDRHVVANGSAFKRSASCRHSKSKSGRGSPRRMERIRRSFRDSFRRRKDSHMPEASKPHQWQSDENAVRNGICAFHVKYLGCVEVFESRGMQVCEDALRVLRNSRRRPVKAILHVSGDGLRVVDDETKGLMVDQTIEKVSFCAPDRNHEKGFSYICRDGTTRRWMCHGFLALRESGERLSHAVGCAFAVCLEKKQRRDKECGVTMNFDTTNSTFTRQGSFRQASITDRLPDPPNITNLSDQINSNNIPFEKNILKESNKQVSEIIPTSKPVTTTPVGIINPPVAPVTPTSAQHNPHAIERPHATPSMLQRQGSFRGFSRLNQASPFKRQLSLRITDLPSNIERTKNLQNLNEPKTPAPLIHLKTPVSPIPESSPQSDSVSAMCQQLSFGLSLLTNKDDLSLNNNNQKNSSTALLDDIFSNPPVMETVSNPAITSVLPEAPKIERPSTDVSLNMTSQHPVPVKSTNPFVSSSPMLPRPLPRQNTNPFITSSPTSNISSIKVFEAHL